MGGVKQGAPAEPVDPTVPGDAPGATAHHAARDARRPWLDAGAPLWPALAFVAAGLFVYFASGPLFFHASAWHSPRDLWLSFRGGQFVAWGDFSSALHYVSAPGTALLLAPPALVTNAFHLIASFPFPLAHPAALLVLGPYTLVVGASVVVATDALGRRLGIRGARQAALNWLAAVLAIPVVALWGHPEDVVAMALAMWAAASAMDGRWSQAGWLFGVAAALQPLVLLLAPSVLALTVPRNWLRVAWRTLAPTAVIMAVPLITTGGDAARFAGEPISSRLNIPTPLAALSPSAGPGLVSAAPERALILVVAALIGLWAWRRHVTPLQALWCGALAMGVRIVLEPVLTPYYLWPAAALLIVVIAAQPRRWAWWALLPLGASDAYAYFPHSPWIYWLPLVVLTAAALGVTGAAVFAEPAGTEARHGAGVLDPRSRDVALAGAAAEGAPTGAV